MSRRDSPKDLFPDANDSELQGVVERVVFASEESGWTVLRLKSAGKAGLQTVVGPLYGVQPGETLRITGEWVEDPKFGRQYRAQSYLALEPKTLGGLESYIGSGLIPGVGKVMAKRIVDRFGLETLEVLDHEPKRLREVEGIGRHRAGKIQAGWEQQREARDVMVFLRSYGVTPSQALKIFRRYGKDSVRLVKSNPYRLAGELHGIGFLTADQIAERLGVARDSPARARAGIDHVLSLAEREGHVFLPRSELLSRTRSLLDQEGDVVEDALTKSLRQGNLVEETAVTKSNERPIYRSTLYRAEVELAGRIQQLQSSTTQHGDNDVDTRIAALSSLRTIRLSIDQRVALEMALTEKMLILTGGPGTGKTTLIRAIVEDRRRLRRRVLLAAPTGRAAKRLASSSKCEARTLHRLLEFDPRSSSFMRNAERPLDADSVIIDETSMLDTHLAFHLFEAIPVGCQVVLVGDVDQLPPIGPGKVLSDLIASEVVPVVRLKEIFRQAESGLIVENAHRIRQGQSLVLERDRPVDFYLIARSDPEELLATLEELVANRVPNRFGFDPMVDLQVLTPMRRGLVGAENLNRRLQNLINARGAPIDLTNGRLRSGDRVMQVRNNYDLDVFNGDIGIVVGPSSDGETVQIRFDDRVVTFQSADLDEVVLAYACSVHKAQGSEFPCVILVLHGQHYVMLQRNLLYTGVTRGERLVIVLGEPKSVSIALANNRPTTRFTMLADRLRANG